uniref:Methyltransferase HEMK2 n=1 Tax=Syphacia muris TaxID=451379 RepID=A0A0N5AQT0_9BILA
MNFATPKYKLTDEEKDHVYDPAEDTFLLLDALEMEVMELRGINPSIIVEVGCGSGVVSAFMQKILNQPSFLIATDINSFASQVTTGSLNSSNIEVVLCDMLSPLYDKLQNAVDILLFNPPYVNTDEKALSWAGGPTGRDAIDRLLNIAPCLLSASGVLYIVAVKTNDIPELLHSNALLSGEIVLQRRCGCEHLYILKFKRK